MLIDGSVFSFGTNQINIFSMNFDASTSMRDYQEIAREGIKSCRDSLKKFSESNTLSISLSMFDDEYRPEPFKKIDEFDADYRAEGCTALYETIVEGGRNLLDYIKKVIEVNGTLPMATFMVFSDGKSCEDRYNAFQAKEALKELNNAVETIGVPITTAFVAFGPAIKSEVGRDLGFVATIDVDDRAALKKFLSHDLPESCKEQSKSDRSLGADFFSQASKASEGYSAKASQVIDNSDWFDDIL